MKYKAIYCHETNEFWPTLSAAAKELGTKIETITRYISGDVKYPRALEGLTLIEIKDDICRKCLVVLTEENQYPLYKGKKLHICKDCQKRVQRQNEYKRCYGILLDEYEDMLKYQNGVCAICKQHETAKQNGKTKMLCVDHDHKTGKVRGLLCTKCNKVLGLVDDNKIILENMIDYLGDKK